MKVLVTGASGFIGKNLIAELKSKKDISVYKYDIDTDPLLLDQYCEEAEFIFHLAGINRPKDQAEFMEGNFGFTSILLDKLKKYSNACPIMISSSTQAEFDNPYGRSKKAGEELIFQYSEETGAKVLVYRFTNVFGKWCKPNYNSVVATFCYNIARNLAIRVDDPSIELNLIYIDDVVEELIKALSGNENRKGAFCDVPVVYKTTLGNIVELLYSFNKSRHDLFIPDIADTFTKNLYSTYTSYLPENEFNYPLKMNIDERGSFTEFIKTIDHGQISVNISKPGIVKGNHWHHTKHEKFLVVAGKGIIRFRNIDSNEIIEYMVSNEKLEVIDIPSGYTHNIENLGETDLVTIMWVNECYNKEKPDTHFLEV